MRRVVFATEAGDDELRWVSPLLPELSYLLVLASRAGEADDGTLVQLGTYLPKSSAYMDARNGKTLLPVQFTTWSFGKVCMRYLRQV